MKRLTLTPRSRHYLAVFGMFSSLLALLLSATACQDDGNDLTANEPPNAVGRIEITAIEDQVGGEPIIVVGSGIKNLIVSFRRTSAAGEILDLKPVQESLPRILEDQHGNIYDVFGRAVSGPDTGSFLRPTYGMMGFWFSFGTFYNNLEIYGHAEGGSPNVEPEPGEAWAVPSEQVLRITSVDAIPALDQPSFVTAPDRPGLPEELSLIQDDDLLLGVSLGEETRLYPHRILDWHEIVNDVMDGEHFSLIYCPLTGTGNAWSRVLDGQETTFGVSGMLYNTNIVPYDRMSGSLWSQLVGGGIRGEQLGVEQPQYHVVETTWAEWKQMLPGVDILSFETGFSRRYNTYPYGDYRTNHNAINFPVSHLDERLPAKERVHFVSINGHNKAYRLSLF